MAGALDSARIDWSYPDLKQDISKILLARGIGDEAIRASTLQADALSKQKCQVGTAAMKQERRSTEDQ